MLMNNGTWKKEDVILLLTDITGKIEPKPAAERERLIQSGIHYSEMLPLESKPSPLYLNEYKRALDNFAKETAEATACVADKIYAKKGRGVVLVSLARAGTPAGVLIKRYMSKKYGFSPPHFTISIVRGRGIDKAAMRYILDYYDEAKIQFIDGWTGKGAILKELIAAHGSDSHEPRELLAVLSDPANITDMCGTHEDFPIASSFLNSTVCGLMSRTVMDKNQDDSVFHGAAFYNELLDEDRTYEFINAIESRFVLDETTGLSEVRAIAKCFNISDINLIKPGIAETTRVLLRRMPYLILVAENAPDKYISHIVQLAKEKGVPLRAYPLIRYKACGIIKELSADA